MVKELLAARLSEIISSTNPNAKVFLEIIELINSSNPLQVSDTLQNVNTAVVFQRLFSASSNPDVITLLQKLLSCLPPSIIISQFRSSLIQGLHHTSLAAKEVVLKELERCANDPSGLQELLHCQDLLCLITRLMGDSNLSLAKHSATILYLLGGSSEGLTTLLGTSIRNEFTEIMISGGDTVRLRIYDMMISVVCSYPSALPLVASVYSDMLLKELESKDVLLQLNCVELLTKLALTNHGLIFLEQQGAIEKFRWILLDSSSESMMPFLFPGLIKFFGNLGLSHPELFFDEYTEVLHYILTLIECQDAILSGVAIETFGIIGSTAMGKQRIDIHAPVSLLEGAFRTIGNCIEGGPSETRIRALEAFTNLLRVERSETNIEIDLIAEKWLKKLSSNDPIRLLLTVSKQPFTELRCGALEAIKQIAYKEWGQRLLQSQSGFLEYLLDRSTENDKQGKESKFGIVQQMVESPTACTVFDTETMTKLVTFYKEGPFYVTGQTELCFEQAS